MRARQRDVQQASQIQHPVRITAAGICLVTQQNIMKALSWWFVNQLI
jgi:hypothetical protein